MELMLRKAKKEDVSLVYEMLVKCGKEMHDKFKLSHWYPFMDKISFERLMEDKYLYCLNEGDRLVGTFNLSTKPRDYYHEELWEIKVNKAIYLGQLATEPSQQSKGIGKWCMKQVENIAREMGCDSIRFDTLNNHPFLKDFYKSLDYLPGKIVTPGKWDLLCFEKKII